MHEIRLAVAVSFLTIMVATAVEGRTLALVIGNRDYQDLSTVDDAVDDAKAIAAHLKGFGVEIFGGRAHLNLSYSALRLLVADYLKSLQELERNDIAVIFYKGHGARDAHGSYIFPVDARKDEDVRRIDWASEILGKAFTHRRRATILFLDACREVPQNYEAGLAEPTLIPANTLISFAAEANRTAVIPSPYAQALTERLGYPGERIEDTLSEVAKAVERISKGQQRPQQYGTANGVTFRPPVQVRFTSIAPDDSVEVRLNGQTVLTTTIAEDGKTATMPLNVGTNEIEVWVYNTKRRRNNQFWQPYEGWRYNVQITTVRGEPIDSLADGEDPGREPRVDRLFLVGTATIEVDKTGSVSVTRKNSHAWRP